MNTITLANDYKDALVYAFILSVFCIIWAIHDWVDESRRAHEENKKLFLSEEERTEILNKILRGEHE